MKTMIVLVTFCVAGFCQAQSMFRGDATHSGSYAAAPRQFHRVKWKFATGDRIVSSPVIENKRIYFGGDDGNGTRLTRKPVGRFGST